MCYLSTRWAVRRGSQVLTPPGSAASSRFHTCLLSRTFQLEFLETQSVHLKVSAKRRGRGDVRGACPNAPESELQPQLRISPVSSIRLGDLSCQLKEDMPEATRAAADGGSAARPTQLLLLFPRSLFRCQHDPWHLFRFQARPRGP